MKSNRIILWLSIVLCLLIAFVSYTGLCTQGFYAKETANWKVQSIGQDMADLFMLVPVILVAALLFYRGNAKAGLVWAGALLYAIYTFVIYCFDVHFNSLFVIYCLTLGMAFYALLYFVYTQIHFSITIQKKVVVTTTGVYLIIIGVLFYFLWLSEVLPAVMHDTTPKTLSEAGLITNPVHVIDLAIFLPGLFITGILLLKKHRLGYLLAPMFLAFFILMDVTIGWLIILMQQRGLDGEMSVVTIMGVLATFSSVLLFLLLKNTTLKEVSH